MDINLKKVHEHMIDLGAGSLSHANYLAHFYDMNNSMWCNWESYRQPMLVKFFQSSSCSGTPSFNF